MPAVLRIGLFGVHELGRILQAVGKAPGSRGLKAVVGESVKGEFKDHLYAKDRQPNKLGGNRTHYWRQAGDSVVARNTAKGVSVAATQIGIRLKATGGTITPKKAKALTIPLHPAAYGKRAREFDDLFIINTKDDGGNTTGFLARNKGTNSFDVYYALRKKATIKADPDIFPPQPIVLQTATRAALEYLRTLEGIN